MHPNATRRADSVISTWMGTATADDDETRSSLAILQSVPLLTIKTVWTASMPLAAMSQASATMASRCANGNGTQPQDLVVVEFGPAAGTASSRVVSTLCCFLRTVACVCVRVHCRPFVMSSARWSSSHSASSVPRLSRSRTPPLH